MPQSSTTTPGSESGGNRLSESSSPYLLQHASNPVNWYPWGDEAFERAAAENKPIFLSIGYSACHWCHVMERESFENEAIAEILNRHFVSIKVDREERPDIDAIYMRAVQMLTGAGGWPMSVFLTPDLHPFYGGTYFPPDDHYGRPGFRRVLLELARLWKDERERLDENAVKIMEGLVSTGRPETGPTELDMRILHVAEDQLLAAHDQQHGGFGGAPKFPPSMALRFLMRRYAHSSRDELLDLVTHTLDRMAAGGIYDQLGGGFHRYSVDERWLVPHFEKMLYDNALLTVVYLEAAQITRNGRYLEVANGCLNFLLRDMQDEAGAFHSTLDADSEGQEGLYYVWQHDEIVDVLGEQDADLFCRLYGVTADGNFEGANILHRAADPEALRRDLDISEEAWAQTLEHMKRRLLQRRSQRVRPHKDDKILTNWNGLALSAFAQGFRVTGNSRYRDAAVGIVQFLRSKLLQNGQLMHSWRQGHAAMPANLDDYAYAIRGLIDLFQVDPDIDHLKLADELATAITEQFAGNEVGELYYTEQTRQHLISRERCDTDAAVPSPAAVAAQVLLRLARLIDSPNREKWARTWAESLAASLKRNPYAYMSALSVIDALLTPDEEIVLAGPFESQDTKRLRDAIHHTYLPNALLLQWDPQSDKADEVSALLPLVRDRDTVNGAPAAYVCRNRTCQRPVTTPEALAEVLEEQNP